MVEVHVAVRDRADVTNGDTGTLQHLIERNAHGLVHRVDLSEADAQPGVEQHRSAGVPDQERVDNDRRARERQMPRRDEVPHVEADDVAGSECHVLAVSRRQRSRTAPVIAP